MAGRELLFPGQGMGMVITDGTLCDRDYQCQGAVWWGISLPGITGAVTVRVWRGGGFFCWDKAWLSLLGQDGT